MTIYALSSGPGLSGIAVIRLSGPNSKEVIEKLTKEKAPKPRHASVKKIYKLNNDELIDEGIILWFPGPNSYTGEDMAEFHIHGSQASINALQSDLSKFDGFRLAEAGEFTKIAFQNGQNNLIKAESIADLITAETEMQRRQAIKLMTGKTSDKFNELRKRVLKTKLRR